MSQDTDLENAQVIRNSSENEEAKDAISELRGKRPGTLECKNIPKVGTGPMILPLLVGTSFSEVSWGVL